ncbi:MAG: hypothetical protein IJ335_08980, partial [Lachnospiraceae bacterium]|nr:hypothetical protein [Lachnospiraceae bacterium]
NRKSSKPIYRDLIRRTAFGVNFAVVAVENQSLPHYLMPLRVMDYDVRQYRKQAKEIWKEVQTLTKPDKAEYLSHFLKSDRLHPCVTLVLFYGEDWDGSRDLHSILDFTDIPKELQPLVNNYRINLLEIRKLEQTDTYRSDIKQVFDFIRYADDKVKLRTLVQHDPAYQQMASDAYDVVAEFTKANELITIKDDYVLKEEVNMCKALTEMLQDERAEGLEQGTLITLYALVQKGRLTLVEAAEEAQMSPTDFESKVKQYS